MYKLYNVHTRSWAVLLRKCCARLITFYFYFKNHHHFLNLKVKHKQTFWKSAQLTGQTNWSNTSIHFESQPILLNRHTGQTRAYILKISPTYWTDTLTNHEHRFHPRYLSRAFSFLLFHDLCFKLSIIPMHDLYYCQDLFH